MCRNVMEGVRRNRPEHPAVSFLRKLYPKGFNPKAIKLLKEKADSVVYRLEGIGQGDSDVIAKRCLRESALVERTVYEELLPRVPVPALHYIGFVEELDSEFCWLFVEDAGKNEYSPHIEQHRALAGHWLGTVHAHMAHDSLKTRLPRRRHDCYLNDLRSARERIWRNLGSPSLKTDDQHLLREILSQLDFLEAHRLQLERFSEGMPETLIHNDFAIKHVRVRAVNGRLSFIAFDWDYSGWGVPCTDLAQFIGHRELASVSPDLNAYASVVRLVWPQFGIEDIRRLANFGTIFRGVSTFAWKSWVLAENCDGVYLRERVKAFIGYARWYHRRMADAISVAGWEG